MHRRWRRCACRDVALRAAGIGGFRAGLAGAGIGARLTTGGRVAAFGAGAEQTVVANRVVGRVVTRSRRRVARVGGARVAVIAVGVGEALNAGLGALIARESGARISSYAGQLCSPWSRSASPHTAICASC